MRLYYFLLFAISCIIAACSEIEQPLDSCIANKNNGENIFRITKEEAIDGSNNFRCLIFGTKTRSTTKPEVTVVTKTETRSQAPDTLYYIINYGKSEGFAVVSADNYRFSSNSLQGKPITQESGETPATMTAQTITCISDYKIPSKSN